MMTGFIFGGNTEVSSPQELAERRSLARAIMARPAGQTPKNIWEGLNSLSEAIGLRMEQNHLDRAEAQGFSGAPAPVSVANRGPRRV